MYKEKKIASYTAPGTRLQLLEGIDNCEVKCYEIRKNRKIVKKSVWENIARQYFYNEIKNHLFQLSLL